MSGQAPDGGRDLIVAALEAVRLLALAGDGFELDPLEARTHSRLLAIAVDRAAPLADRVWTASELATAWHVSVSTVRGWIDDGEMEVFNVGRGSVPHWRIDNAEALRFAEVRRRKPAPGS